MPADPRLNRAAHILRSGGVIGYPTEAVYGLGCLPLNTDAILRLIGLKGRSARKGLILIAADIAQIDPFVDLSQSAVIDRIHASWPGPQTWVLPAKPLVPALLTGGRDTLAVRITAHPVAGALCARVGSAIVSTSANLSGHPPARSALALRRRLGRKIDYVLAGRLGGNLRPTSIRDGRSGALLRPG